MFPDALLSCLVAIAILSLTLATLCHAVARWMLRRPRRRGGMHVPGITVLKPLSGMDEGLHANLLSIIEQDYPNFEVIFGVEEARDPACAVVRQLQRSHPQTQIRLVVGGPKIGVNPKVANLANMAAVARHDLVLISDANVRVDADYLRAVADCDAPDVGLVCNVIVARDAQSLGALCEDLHLNTFIMPSVCTAFAVARHPCVVGKSMLLRLTNLRRFGGWHAVAHVLAEDYVLGQTMHRAGLKVVLCPYAIQAVHQHRRLWSFVERHVRWSQMRWRLAPAAYIGELLLNTVPWAWAWGAIALTRGSYTLAAGAALVWAAKMALDLWTHAAAAQRPVGMAHAFVLILKDAMLPAIWVLGIVCRNVNWRGHAMRIGRGSVVRAHIDVGLPAPMPRHPESALTP